MGSEGCGALVGLVRVVARSKHENETMKHTSMSDVSTPQPIPPPFNFQPHYHALPHTWDGL